MTPQVTVYTRPDCRACKRMMVLLGQAEITYEVIDIDEPRYADARTYVTETLGAKGVPVIVADDFEPILGYQPDQLKKLIEHLKGKAVA